MSSSSYSFKILIFIFFLHKFLPCSDTLGENLKKICENLFAKIISRSDFELIKVSKMDLFGIPFDTDFRRA